MGTRTHLHMLISFAILGGCLQENPLYCESSADCARKSPHLPFCDLVGEYEESNGVARTCISDPVAPCEQQLLFQRSLDGNQELFIVNADGMWERNISNNPEDDTSAHWSAATRKLVFQRSGDIYIANEDGSGQQNLTASVEVEGSPHWSPDTESIVYIGDHGGNTDVFSIRVDGTSRVNLTNHPDGDWLAKWSPNRPEIAFASTRNDINNVLVMNTDGSEQTALTVDAAPSVALEWSPDGEHIAYGTRTFTGKDSGVWMVNRDGSGHIALEENITPAGIDWSPDSQQIVYSDSYEIIIVNRDGSDRTVWATGEEPSWSRDGRWIAFVGDDSIYRMNSDGSGLTSLNAKGTDPQWIEICPEE